MAHASDDVLGLKIEVLSLAAAGLNDNFCAELSDRLKINEALAKATSDMNTNTREGELF